MEGTKIYRLWSSMLTRCRNPKSPTYKNHGGRGIKVCERWLSFENFYADMGDRPEGKQLERKDNDGDYTPDNCVWATKKDQANNRRTNRKLTFNGRTQTATQWADELGVSLQCLIYRLKKGVPFEMLGYKGVISGAGVTAELATQIRLEYMPYKVTARMLAEKYGVSVRSVQDIVSGTRWCN